MDMRGSKPEDGGRIIAMCLKDEKDKTPKEDAKFKCKNCGAYSKKKKDLCEPKKLKK